MTSFVDTDRSRLDGALPAVGLPRALSVYLAAAVALAAQQAVRIPLHLPGHRGLLVMAILVAGRCTGGHRWAGSAIGCVAGAAVLGLGGGADGALTLAVAGVALDAGLRVAPGATNRRWTIGAIGAIAYLLTTISPVLKSLAVGAPDFALVHGLGFPLITHAAFGAAGAVLGFLAATAARRPRR